MFSDVRVVTRLKQRNYHEFEANLGCIVKACLKIDYFSPKNILCIDDKPVTDHPTPVQNIWTSLRTQSAHAQNLVLRD